MKPTLRALPAQKYPVVGTDNRLGGQLGTDHLILHSRRRIAFPGEERLPEVGHATKTIAKHCARQG